ncbi:hypothetical protein SynBIOSU31_03053 [Synechococcus sp. BIOS-U3-1]|nr:hypothetical protein SynBIOSU31_03053 [Synechococcus sp. BIOS-U3-1]
MVEAPRLTSLSIHTREIMYSDVPAYSLWKYSIFVNEVVINFA